jgi:nucleoid DNA-binding protein
MKKQELAQRVAKEERLSTAVAADEVDRMFGELIAKIRKGQDAAVPGLGILQPHAKSDSGFEKPAAVRKRKSR